MNLDHLKYFRDAALVGSISKAARENFVTQSAVSRAVAKLEEDLGAELVVHGKNRFQLTEVGEAVLARATEIFDSIRVLKDETISHASTLKGPLRVGCNQAIASRLIAPTLTELTKSYPKIEPVILLGNTDQVQQSLDRGEIDFGIVMDDGDVGTRYKSAPLYKGEFVVVKATGNRDADPAENLVVSRTKKGGVSQKYLASYKREYGTSIAPKLTVASWQVIMDLAIAGYGCALVPSFLCKEELERKTLELVRHKVKAIPFTLCVIVARGKVLPKNAKALISAFETSTAKI